jgi:hypothetical protein
MENEKTVCGQSILDRMIFYFSEMSRFTFHHDKLSVAHRDKMKKEGFELFFKYFEALWW